MDIKNALSVISSCFKYRSDPKLFDYWLVMKERNGVMEGDCDDFSMTTIWMMCDRNFFIFVWNVMILHRYKFYYAKTSAGEGHMVGYADGLWFDNWTKCALSKEEFIDNTKHKIYFFWPGPLMIPYLILGLVLRIIRD
jgi:hypothetical protein